MSYPVIIQGGMGVAVSGWRLARAVAVTGQMGVVAGTALATVQARILQQGDPGGHLRRALDHFPVSAVAERIWNAYYVPGGIEPGTPFKPTPMPSLTPSVALTELTVVASFAEVWLAKEGHDGRVGINLLEKIQLPTIPSLYGAMLAGVDYVLMGAGIPRSIPGLLDALARGEPAAMRIDVSGDAPDAPTFLNFDPSCIFAGKAPALARPEFLAIVASATLAITLARKSNGAVNGFVVEGATAGGHNAPPRGAMQLTPTGEPLYGPRDLPELAKIRDLGLPFWLAGSHANPEKISDAIATGASGVQVGTAFALCDESGIFPELKRRFRELVRSGAARIFTDPLASPTGFPVQGNPTRRHALGCRRIRRPFPDLRPGLSPPALPPVRRNGRLPLRCGIPRRLRAKGRRCRRSQWPEVPVQRPDCHRWSRSIQGRRRRAADHHLR